MTRPRSLPPPTHTHKHTNAATHVQMSDATGRVLCNFNLSQDDLPGRTRLMCCISRYGKDMR